MQFTKQQKVILSIAGFIVLFFILVFLGIVPGLQVGVNKPAAELNFWGIDDRSAFDAGISKYQSAHPKVKIEYRQINETNYEKELLNALAAGQGPDIFVFHNTWLPKHKNKILPATSEKISLSTFRSVFPQVAEQDFVLNGQIYASPLFIDTLALFYNKDIFDNKRIAIPPVTWEEFKKDVNKIKEFSSGGNLYKSAASIGGTLKNIPNAVDILSMLMLQFKTKMTDDDFSGAAFHSPEGLKALDFYTQFAQPGQFYYTWNDLFQNSIESFASGKTAMIFAYAGEIPKVKAKNPLLNFGIQPAPQFNKSETVSYANYWGLAVSKKTKSSDGAWDFIISLTTNSENVESYVLATGKPPALRFLINNYLDDPNFGVFAAQALTARSWPQIDNTEVRKIFNNMIESVLTKRLAGDKALGEAEEQITGLMQGR